MKRLFFAIALFSCTLTLSGVSRAAGPSVPFSLLGESMRVEQLRPGMRGYARTVVSGTEVTQFPVEIVSIIPQKGSPKNLIMIRASGAAIGSTGGIAAGMSGSPVYIKGKLVGAIGYGWNFSDHTLGLVTPYEDMASIWKWPERTVAIRAPSFPAPEGEKREKEDSQGEGNATLKKRDGTDSSSRETGDRSSLFINGLSVRSSHAIASLLGKRGYVPGGGNAGDLPIEENAKLEPGEALAVLLAWGDVTVGTTGTLTALGKDGKFLAFAHPFLGKGAVNYPVARAFIHGVVPSMESPFKIGTALRIVGTVTQDRQQAIGGRIGFFTPSFSGALAFTDLDRGESGKKMFRVVPDPFMGSKLSTEIYTGLIDELWGRKGEGTASISLIVQGRGLKTGWSRRNMFYSDTDVTSDSMKEMAEVLDVLFLNPFSEIYPLGITVVAEFTQEPKVMFIEGLQVQKESVSPGDTVDVEVTLRPYRRKETKRTFTLTVPEGAVGTCEILVRGGGIEPLSQSALIQGWKTIATFEQLLTEMAAPEVNNELIIELNCDALPDMDGLSGEENEAAPKEEELLSELKKRRLEEGTMKIFSSEYVVDGLLRKNLTVAPKESETQDRKAPTGK